MIEGDNISMGGAQGYGSRDLTPEMRHAAEVFLQATTGHITLAERLEAIWRAKGGDESARFSQREVISVTVREGAFNELVALGVLAIVKYPSGAWQYAFTPYTKAWFFTVQALAEAKANI